MSDVELGRLRMLEIQSGAFHTAHQEAHSQEVVGPPLSDREKVLHAINRLTFGLKPGQIQKILEDSAAANEKTGALPRLGQEAARRRQDRRQGGRAGGRQALPLGQDVGHRAEEGIPLQERGDGRTGPSSATSLPQLVLYRAVNSNRQFKEVMCEFWRNHFCIDNSPERGQDPLLGGRPLRRGRDPQERLRQVQGHALRLGHPPGDAGVPGQRASATPTTGTRTTPAR